MFLGDVWGYLNAEIESGGAFLCKSTTRIVAQIELDIATIQAIDSLIALGRARIIALNCSDPEDIGRNIYGYIADLRDSANNNELRSTCTLF